MINLVEKYITIAGELPMTGMPIYLLRFSGCNLNCTYCDTPYKDEINDSFTKEELIDDIVNETNQYPDLKVLFTGGEPLLGDRQQKLISIIKELENIDFYIETNGSIELDNLSLANCYYIIDWKSPSSGHVDSFCFDNLKYLRIDKDCIKLIINKNDFEWVKEVIKIVQKTNPFIPLYLSAQWNKLKLDEAVGFILKNRLPVRLSIQMHKIIWHEKSRRV